MMKILGSILLVGACWGIGSLQYERVKLRVTELVELCRITEILNREIVYHMTPLPEAFLTTAEKMKLPFGPVFQEVGERLNEKEGTTFLGIWEEVWERRKNTTHLMEEELDGIRTLGTSLGQLDKKMQTEALAFFEKQLLEQIADLKKQLGAQKRVYQTLGLMGGFLLVIILI